MVLAVIGVAMVAAVMTVVGAMMRAVSMLVAMVTVALSVMAMLGAVVIMCAELAVRAGRGSETQAQRQCDKQGRGGQDFHGDAPHGNGGCSLRL